MMALQARQALLGRAVLRGQRVEWAQPVLRAPQALWAQLALPARRAELARRGLASPGLIRLARVCRWFRTSATFQMTQRRSH